MSNQNVIEFEKADLTVTPPGGGTIRFAILEGKKGQPLPSTEKRRADDIYYRMYKDHPIVRAAIDKAAEVAASNGFYFRPEDQSAALDETKAKELRLFFKRSGGKTLFFQLFQDLKIYGRAFWWLEYRGQKPYRAKRLHPKYVDWFSDGREVTKFRYGPVSTETADEYEVNEIMSFRVPNPDDDLMGLAPLTSLEKTVATDLFAMDYNSSFFENNAQTGIVIQIKGASEEELIRNRAWIEENYVGSENAHKPLILEGDVEVKKSVSTQHEMGFIEGRKMNREEILAVIDVPPEKLGFREDSNRSTAKEGANSFRSESIRPLQALVEEPINSKLILELFEWDDIEFGFNEVDKVEEMANLEVITKAQSNGLLNTDEGRARLGYGKAGPGGDIHFYNTSAGLVPLEFLREQAETALAKEKVGLKQAERLAAAPIPAFQGGTGPQDGPAPAPAKPAPRAKAVTEDK